MDSLDAIMMIEEQDCSFKEYVEAVAVLMKSGQIWQLQGMYGRIGRRMIEGGIMDMEGNINWDKVKEIEEE